MHPSKPKPVMNLADVEVGEERAPRGNNAHMYDIRRADIGRRIGARQLGYNLTVVAPGKRNCPFHSHRAEEEMFLILEGNGELRYGDARYPLRPGDVVACPTGGPESAHQIINTGTTEMRYLSLREALNKSILDLPEHAESGTCPDSASPNQSLARLICGGPSLARRTSDQNQRFLSTMAPIEICDYPDSGKFGVYEDQPWDDDRERKPFRHLARREDARDYWEGE